MIPFLPSRDGSVVISKSFGLLTQLNAIHENRYRYISRFRCANPVIESTTEEVIEALQNFFNKLNLSQFLKKFDFLIYNESPYLSGLNYNFIYRLSILTEVSVVLGFFSYGQKLQVWKSLLFLPKLQLINLTAIYAATQYLIPSIGYSKSIFEVGIVVLQALSLEDFKILFTSLSPLRNRTALKVFNFSVQPFEQNDGNIAIFKLFSSVVAEIKSLFTCMNYIKPRFHYYADSIVSKKYLEKLTKL